MKLTKLLSSIALTTALILSTTSCESTSKSDEIKINIFQFKVEIHDQFQQAIDTYTKEHPNIKINVETVGGGDDYGPALRSKFGADTTIFNVGGPQDVQDWMGKLEDLSNEKWVDQAVDGVLDPVKVDGKVYGLPYSIEGYGLIYNKEIFEKAGIDATTLTTYKKMEEAFKILQEKIDSGALKEDFPNLEAVTELPGKETWVTGLHSINVALNQEFGTMLDTFNAKTVDFKYADSLKKYLDLQADYSKYAKEKGKLNAVQYIDQVDAGLAVERVAVIQQGNWIYDAVSKIDPAVAKKLGILPTPLEGVKEDSIPVGVPMYWCINSEANEASKTAAKEFLNWLYQSEEGKKIVVNDFGFIPPFKNYSGLEPADVLGQSIKSYVDNENMMSWVFMGFPSGWGMDVFGSKLQGYFEGSLSFEQVISESKQEWEKSRSSS